MRFTVDTVQRTIEIHSSFQFQDFTTWRASLPQEWADYTITVGNTISWTYGTGTAVTNVWSQQPNTLTGSQVNGQYRLSLD
jgi:hypothetical protein